MSRRIVVSGNCQISGFAAALRLIFPDDLVYELLLHVTIPGAREAAEVELAAADVWIAMPSPENEELAVAAGPAVRRISWPNLNFNGFHPDLVYALQGPDIFRGVSDYHSAIGLWAWKRGLEPADAVHLFVPEVFDALGYFQYFITAQRMLGAEIEAAGLDFGRFWLRAKRLGVFMHTVNHPGINVLTLVAQHVALRIGADEGILTEPLERYLEDALVTSVVWPVYPAIARYLGVAGSFRFSVQGRQFPTLEDFLVAQWEAYGEGKRGAVSSVRNDDELCDAVLTPLIGVRA